MARSLTVHLLTGDYSDRLDALWAEVNRALDDKTPRTMAEEDPAVALGADYKALREEALAQATTVTLTSVSRRVWRELKAKYPPRSGEGVDAETAKEDRASGVNTDAIEDDLVYATVTSPEFSSRAAFDEWADTLSEGEWQTLLIRSWELANGARMDPKELPSSATRNAD